MPYQHSLRCDRDLCVPECPLRRRAVENDEWYPGRK